MADEPEIYIYHRVQLKELKETILFVVMPAVDGETSRLELESFLPELVHIIFVVLRVISVMHTVIDQIDGIKVKIFFSEQFFLTLLPPNLLILLRGKRSRSQRPLFKTQAIESILRSVLLGLLFTSKILVSGNERNFWKIQQRFIATGM